VCSPTLGPANTMNRQHTDHITLGRNVVLTFRVLAGIHKRRVREAIAARRRKKIVAILQKVIDTLRFWK